MIVPTCIQDKRLLQMEREVKKALREGDVSALLAKLAAMFPECSATPEDYREDVVRSLAKTVFKTAFRMFLSFHF